MNNLLHNILVVILPLVISNTLHMVVVKKKAFPGLNIPIGEKIFGANKTWRGFIFLPVMNGLVLFAINIVFELSVSNPLFIGALLGFMYLLFELPNSFLKRRLGIKAGETAARYKYATSLIDKMDSAFGVCLTYYLLKYMPLNTALVMFVLCSLTHIVFSQILYQLKIKKSF